MQIAGVLVLAAGVPRAFDQRDFTVIVLGYAVMRPALVCPVAAGGAATRRAARRRAALRRRHQCRACSAGCGLLLLPALGLPVFLVMVAVELAVPVWAERATGPPGTRTTSPSGSGCSP